MIKKNFDIGYKIWLDKDGMAFGLGPYYLLKNIQVSSSLSKAALDLRMSYRQAWGLIKECETKLGFDLIERQAGGASGGYSLLTPEGEKFLFWFEGLHDEIAKTIEKIFQKKLEKLV
ncbi:MAG: LysR family transcriptional regulator [Spirochaetes bacterium]|nr:LysR family transcriptional regulator [Spirochaetota bacterium]